MKKTGWIKLFCLVLAIGAIAFVSLVGFGDNAVGSYKDISLGLDLAGGVSITYQAVKEDPTTEEMEDARYKLMKRAEGKSTESAVYIEGTNRINVDIPNVTDANRILEEMGLDVCGTHGSTPAPEPSADALCRRRRGPYAGAFHRVFHHSGLGAALPGAFDGYLRGPARRGQHQADHAGEHHLQCGQRDLQLPAHQRRRPLPEAGRARRSPCHGAGHGGRLCAEPARHLS